MVSIFHALLIALALVAAHAATSATSVVYRQQGEATQLLINALFTADSSLRGVDTMVVSGTNGIEWPSSKAVGQGSLTTGLTKQLSHDSCFSANTMLETLVAAAVVKLQQDTAFTNSLDDQISTTFSPGGVTLANPTTGAAITYRMLMQHTSTISDTGFAGSSAKLPATVGTLQSFVESYFVSASGSLITTVFTSKDPGTADAYAYARVNTALLAYIVGKVISANSLAFGGVEDYLYQAFLLPFGMSNTFFLNVDGSVPGTTYIPSYTATFTTPTASSAASYGATRSACIVDQISGDVYIHPAFVADFMPQTTISDLTKLTYFMFVHPMYTTVTVAMKQLLLINAGTATVVGQSGRGLGLMYYSSSSVCSAATSSNVISSCPLTNTSVIYGNTNSRGRTTEGFVCVDDTTVGVLCVISVKIHSTSSTRSTSDLLALTATAAQDIVGTVTADTTSFSTTTTEDPWFGVYVFVGVYGTVIVAYLVTQLFLFLFLQVSVASSTNAGGAANLATPER